MTNIIENNITTLIQASLEELTNSRREALTNQVGNFMEELNTKIAAETNGGSKRTRNPIVSPSQKLRKSSQKSADGKGNHNNATSMPDHDEDVDVMQS